MTGYQLRSLVDGEQQNCRHITRIGHAATGQPFLCEAGLYA